MFQSDLMLLNKEHACSVRNNRGMSQQCVYLLYPLSLLLGGDGSSGGDAEALLEHGHAGLGLAALDLWHPGLLLLLPGF